MSFKSIALIGLGEVGTILADDLSQRGFTLSAWDVRFADPASPPSLAAASRPFLRRGSDAADAVAGADLVISAVTAARTIDAAKAAAAGMAAGAVFVDFNSASPGAKGEAAAAMNGAGARYVEAAVMSPVPPKRLGTPILLGGPHADAVLAALRDIGLSNLSVFSAEYGKASAAKMCRSVMVKGIEALLSESLLAARHYGVDDTVLTSLNDLFPGPDWHKLSRYMISRTMEHGKRRAEEMREVARTVEEAGLSPWMSLATVERQEWAPPLSSALDQEEITAMLDAMRVQFVPGSR
ncbi:NAD(P)-dependent oxidoreductase [Niveispirillum sp. BGYR6]|uniref:NAD(P)-dependent oxidoreductase n=1 Tax=Niveispirillum sp. BGYR6 TaxID=2971249 RepID=UPI0022B954FD|nr:NAD(P)-dependent oxidoreductase [Niveispirillum sp. BGYR6]MDG5493351.1 DUF1932 domain-containing protein [Niveispirillum sp. BGYR6]